MGRTERIRELERDIGNDVVKSIRRTGWGGAVSGILLFNLAILLASVVLPKEYSPDNCGSIVVFIGALASGFLGYQGARWLHVNQLIDYRPEKKDELREWYENTIL